MPTIVAAQGTDPTTAGVVWLREQQLENGSYGDEIGATAFSLIAFATENEINAEAMDWLSTRDYSTVGLDEVSLTLIALVATDTDVASFADGELLARHSALLREAEAQRTDALCLGLVARYNLDIPLQDAALDSILSRQNADGGFSVTTEDASDVTTTAICMHVLAAAESTDVLATTMDYLRATQLDDDGWSIDAASITSDPLGTAFAMLGLIAAGESLANWGNPERTLVLFVAEETGAFVFSDDSDLFTNIISTIVAIPVFRGFSLNSFAPALQSEETVENNGDVPVLDANWKLVGDGFGFTLDSADDFFTLVIDPFTDEELYGVEIINWTADYTYTGYIVEGYLTAEILMWMAEQEPDVYELISPEALGLMAEAELVQLPDDVQARAN